MRKIFLVLAAFSMFLGTSCTQENKPEDKKYVGIFYFLCNTMDSTETIFDVTKLLKEAPEDLYNLEGTPKSPYLKPHYWGEPLYGYYDSRDPWVIVRHIELLMNAGVDYLMMDTTNAAWFPEVVNTLLARLRYFADQGFDVPKVAFYTNTRSGYTVQNIYDEFYKSGKWDGLFFCPNGKPFIVGMTENNRSSLEDVSADPISKELQEYFDVHESQWPNAPFAQESFPWIDWDYPQKIHDGGVISVSVAQHDSVTVSFSDTLNCHGRGYDAVLGKNIHSEMRNGLNFQNQWKTALDNIDKVNNVFVTGWNEWTAYKLSVKGRLQFYDLFNEECSRDIEMMKGGYGDNFYIQLADNIQRFKGECGIAAQHDGFYLDPQGDALVRDYRNINGSEHFFDNSARNDIVSIKVTDDGKDVVFEITTAAPVTPYSNGDLGWMNILVKTDSSKDRFFEYDYVINRYPTVNGSTTVERITPSGKKTVGQAAYSCKGNVLKVSVPVESLGLSKDSVHFSFKVADNVTHPDDIMDYYISGDSAPLGRLSFEY